MWKFRSARPPSSTDEGSPTSRPPDGWRIYAFGDLHGRRDLLERLRSAIAADIDRSTATKNVIVGLGDYIDRGPDSRPVIDILLQGLVPQAEQILLRGNHEDLLLRFLDDPVGVGSSWFQLGGLECLRSYGVDVRPFLRAGFDARAARQEFMRLMPSEHLRLIESMPLRLVAGDYFFVHAGVRPGIPLDQQAARDLLWIRREFIEAQPEWDKVIVHGHFPVAEPFIGARRINLDTGAFVSNRLTCIILESSGRHLLQV
jgi:serine/threonine protein phosphatase 1